MNQFEVVCYPADKPDGLVCGYANSLETAETIATKHQPATIWNQWNKEVGKDKKRHYQSRFVKCVGVNLE